MKAYNAENIRNIVLAGHGGRGKTSLAEAMLYLSGSADRLGRIADGTTVLDSDPEEKKRKASVSTAVAYTQWKDTKINIIDTPGLFDFAGGMSEGMRAAECALIVTAAGCKYDVGAEKAFKAAEKRNIARMIVITKTDAENTNFYKTISLLREVHGNKICPVVVPYYDASGESVEAYVNLITKKAYKYENGKAVEVPTRADEFVDEMNSVLCEAVASADDELMENSLRAKSSPPKRQ